MSKILVTGGAGFIGSNLVRHFYKDNQIVVVDDLSMGNKSNIDNLTNVIFHKDSVTNFEFMENLLVTENFDYIFHLAAVASVADSIKRPVETNQVNLLSTLNMLEVLRKMDDSKLKRFLFASSAAVYGDDKSFPKKEDSPIKPLSPYAIDKFSSEQYTILYSNLYGIPTSSVRFFNVYGPNQNPSSPYSGVISVIVDKFKKQLNGESVHFDLFGDGSQTRDFIFVTDVVKALEIVAFSNDSVGEVYNVGTGNETSLNDLIKIVSKNLNESINIRLNPKREGDIEKSVASINKLKKLGFETSYSVVEGLKNYLISLNLLND